MLNILLRTVCGCERFVTIPDRTYPFQWRIPYVRRNHFWYTGEAADAAADYKVRTFERTGQTGMYGYPVYLEML